MESNIDPKYYEKLAQIESSNNPNAKAKTSSAAGLYQFTKGTWNDIVKKLKLDYTEEDRYDPEKSKVVIEQFTKDNKNYLEGRLGRSVTEGELYLAHFLGRGGAMGVLSSMDQNFNEPIENTISQDAIDRNQSIFLNEDGSTKRNVDIYNWANTKFGIPNNKSGIDPQIITDNNAIPPTEQEQLLTENDANGLDPATIQELNFSNPNKLNPFAYQDSITAFKKGGYLQSSQEKAFTEFNEGGKHEDTAQGGIAIGQNDSGGMNLVEEGETKYNDYIFSDELKLNDKLSKQFNLPEKYNDLSFAEISKDIQSQIEARPFDKITEITANNTLDQLIYANETLRIKQEDMKKKKKDKKFLLGGSNLEGAYDKGFSRNALGKEYDSQFSGANQGIDTAKDTAAAVIGPWGALFRGLQRGGVAAGDAVGGDVGAGISDLFSPEESTFAMLKSKNTNFLEKVGGTVPILGGILNRKEKNKELNQQQNDYFVGKNSLHNSMFNHGGPHKGGLRKDWWKEKNQDLHATGDIKASGPLDYSLLGEMFANKLGSDPLDTSMFNLPNQDFTGREKEIGSNNTNSNNSGRGSSKSSNQSPLLSKLQGTTNGLFQGNTNMNFTLPGKQYSGETSSGPSTGFSNLLDKLKSVDGNGIMRAAPVIGNLARLLNPQKAETERLDRMDNRFNPKYVDERSLLNNVQNATSNTQRAIVANSAGSSSSARAGLLASQINETRALGEAMFQANNMNNAQDNMADQFNFKVDSTNLSQSNNEKHINAQNRAAAQSQKEMLLNAVLGDIGNMGKEGMLNDILKNTTGYGMTGKHVEKRNGGTLSSMFNNMRNPNGTDIEDLIKERYGY